MKKVLFGFAFLAAMSVFVSCNKEEAVINTDESFVSMKDGDIIPGSYVVVYKNNSTLKSVEQGTYAERTQLMEKFASKTLESNGIESAKLDIAYSTALKGFTANLTNEEVSRLAKDQEIDYILPNRWMVIQGKPTGGGTQPAQVVPWGIARVGYGSGVGKVAWIIDTGIDFNHTDLTIDKTRSRDFTTNGTGGDDNQGHGTHCAGTVAALNNAYGVVGVAAGATVVAVKVLDRRGSGQYSWIIAGVDYVAATGKAGDAANMSLGGGAYQAIDDAVYNASQKGIFFALAAGNESTSATTKSPARVNGPNIWTISSFASGDLWSSFSNYGNPPVDFAMPGSSIYSCADGGGYTTMSGTSMATPHMCGVLLMTGGRPATSGTVKNDPDGNADPIGHL